MRPYRPVIIVPLLVLFSAAAWAETTSLPLTDDVRINANKPTSNFDGYDLLAHDYGPKYSLVRFDAASISGQSISSAVLELYLSSIRQDGTISLHAITSSWSEATVTWDTQPPAEAAVAAIANLSTGDVGGTVAIDVTATVQRWADGSLADAGFLIVTNDDIKAFFDAKETTSGVRPALNVDWSPSTPQVAIGIGTTPVVLDLSSPPVIIDEPGHYVVDQNWSLDNLVGGMIDMIDIQASDVVLDLRGFIIKTGQRLGVLIKVEGDRVTVKDGILDAEDSEVYAVVHGTGLTMRLQNLRIIGQVDVSTSIKLAGSFGSIINCLINTGIDVESSSSGSVILSSQVYTYSGALMLIGSDATVAGNQFYSWKPGVATVAILGASNKFSQNTVEYGDSLQTGLELSGNNNLILGNTFDPYDGQSGAVLVSGTQNILKDNVVLPIAPPLGPAAWGISFEQSGNVYGNNSVSATQPFSLGSTTQVDLGGNSGY